MKCIYCGNEKLYQLKTSQLKCSKCKKKFSYKKLQKEIKIIECFCNNYTVNYASNLLNVNYVTIKKRYDDFRYLVSNYLEQEYQNKEVLEYDEYIYLQKNKKKTKENIFDAQNFITFNYENKIYNLLMPSLKKYKNEFLINGAQDAYFKEFSKFMIYNKISKTQKRNNIISKFWIFFEKNILIYKGINADNFFYYLKEMEFKFNYNLEMQKEILTELYTQFNLNTNQ